MPSEEYLKRKNAYIKRYQKEKYILFTLKCRKDTDGEMIEFLKNSENTTKTIHEAVAAYMAEVKHG